MRLTNFFVLSIMGVTAHDASQCRKNGVFDHDCCAIKGDAQCGNDFSLRWGDICHSDARETTHSYFCDDPKGQEWPEAIKQLHNESKCDIGQNCFAIKENNSGKLCQDDFVQYWGKQSSENNTTYEYFCLPKEKSVK